MSASVASWPYLSVEDSGSRTERRVSPGPNMRWMLIFWPLLGAFLSGCEDADILHSSYPTYEAAVQDGAIRRGWVPEFLPRSARQIQEVHNIDTNEIWLGFDFAEEDRSALVSACTMIPASVVRLPRNPSPRFTLSWPRELHKGATLMDSELTFFRCEERNRTDPYQSYLALEHHQAKAWFWSVHRE